MADWQDEEADVNDVRPNQQTYAANLLLAATDADETETAEQGQGDPDAEARASEDA